MRRFRHETVLLSRFPLSNENENELRTLTYKEIVRPEKRRFYIGTYMKKTISTSHILADVIFVSIKGPWFFKLQITGFRV